MEECLFCKIIRKELASTAVYEDDLVYAFRDIAPVAPQHILVVPKEHIESVASLDGSHSSIIGRVFEVIADVGRDVGVDESGYRVVSNVGADAGQTVGHLHFHVLGGRVLGGMC